MDSMLDDPLKRAEIEVIAGERAVEVAGLADGATVELPPKRRLKLPAGAPPAPVPAIEVDTPRPLSTPARAARRVEVEVELISEDLIASLPRGRPIVYTIANAERVDLRHFRPVAAQAADHGRPLVIIANGHPSG